MTNEEPPPDPSGREPAKVAHQSWGTKRSTAGSTLCVCGARRSGFRIGKSSESRCGRSSPRLDSDNVDGVQTETNLREETSPCNRTPREQHERIHQGAQRRGLHQRLGVAATERRCSDRRPPRTPGANWARRLLKDGIAGPAIDARATRLRRRGGAAVGRSRLSLAVGRGRSPTQRAVS